MCKHPVKKLPYLIRFVPDGYKTQQICDKAILENDGTLKSVPDRYNRKCEIKQLIINLEL